jgi:HD superfamily phosphohydrolase
LSNDDRSLIPPPHDFVIRDPMLGDIRLTAAEKQVLDSDIFQRQRGVKQLGTSMLLYPSAVQTRFVHALGNLQIAGLMVERALDNSSPEVRTKFLASAQEWLTRLGADGEQQEKKSDTSEATTRERIEQIVRIAGMCHDLGHFPMGHVLEYALE